MSSPGATMLQLTAELVDIPSVSHDEDKAAAFVAGALGDADHLATTRIGNNVVSRTSLGRSRRLLIAGHLDTVPPNGNEHAVIDGERCSGLGSADMKGGVAVMIELAKRAVEPMVDLSFVWYACEEVEQRYSGLIEIETVDRGLLAADAAVLAEPTSAVVEAGCQGVLRIAVCLGGERAHTARSWMGVNAIHRLGMLLDLVDGFDERMPALDGCEYRESLQAVRALVDFTLRIQNWPQRRLHRPLLPLLRCAPPRCHHLQLLHRDDLLRFRVEPCLARLCHSSQ